MIEKELLVMCKSATLVGSQATCNPPPLPANSDFDWLLLVENLQMFVAGATSVNGFTLAGSLGEMNGTSQFRSLKKGSLNLIVTECEEFHGRFLAATSVAKRLNILNKQDRVALFQAVLYGRAC